MTILQGTNSDCNSEYMDDSEDQVSQPHHAKLSHSILKWQHQRQCLSTNAASAR